MNVRYSKDGEHLISAGGLRDDGHVKFWDLKTARNVRFVCDGLANPEFSTDGTMVLACTKEHVVHLYSARTGKSEHHIAAETTVSALGFLPDGNVFFTTLEPPQWNVWNPKQSVLQVQKEFPGEILDWNLRSPTPQVLLRNAASPDASVDGLNRLEIHSVGSGNEVIHLSTQAAIWTANFSTDGKLVAAHGPSRVANLWSIENRDSVRELLHEPVVRNVLDVEFDQNSAIIATGVGEWTGAGHVRLWSTDTGDPLGAPLRCRGYVSDICLSADGRFVAAASNDHTAVVWNTKTALPVSAPLRHSEEVSLVTLSNDGSLLLTAGDSTVSIWRTRTSELLATYEFLEPVREAKFNKSESHVLVSGETTGLIWTINSLLPDDDQLVNEAWLRSGRRMNDNGAVESISPKELRELWLDSDTGVAVQD